MASENETRLTSAPSVSSSASMKEFAVVTRIFETLCSLLALYGFESRRRRPPIHISHAGPRRLV